MRSGKPNQSANRAAKSKLNLTDLQSLKVDVRGMAPGHYLVVAFNSEGNMVQRGITSSIPQLADMSDYKMSSLIRSKVRAILEQKESSVPAFPEFVKLMTGKEAEQIGASQRTMITKSYDFYLKLSDWGRIFNQEDTKTYLSVDDIDILMGYLTEISIAFYQASRVATGNDEVFSRLLRGVGILPPVAKRLVNLQLPLAKRLGNILFGSNMNSAIRCNAIDMSGFNLEAPLWTLTKGLLLFPDIFEKYFKDNPAELEIKNSTQKAELEASYLPLVLKMTGVEILELNPGFSLTVKNNPLRDLLKEEENKYCYNLKTYNEKLMAITDTTDLTMARSKLSTMRKLAEQQEFSEKELLNLRFKYVKYSLAPDKKSIVKNNDGRIIPQEMIAALASVQEQKKKSPKVASIVQNSMSGIRTRDDYQAINSLMDYQPYGPVIRETCYKALVGLKDPYIFQTTLAFIFNMLNLTPFEARQVYRDKEEDNPFFDDDQEDKIPNQDQPAEF